MVMHTSTSAWSARNKDGERSAHPHAPEGHAASAPVQSSQHAGSTSGSAWRPSDGDGDRRARGIQLAQHRGCSSSSAWRGSDAAAGGRPPLLQDVSDRPGSSRGGISDSTSLMVDHFIQMGFPVEKVRQALENAGHQEEALLDWLVAHQETDLSTDTEGADMTDIDDKVLGAELTEKDKKFLYLVEMGFTEDEVSSSINICGEHESLEVLADAIFAAQVDKRGGSYGRNIANVELSPGEAGRGVKRKNVEQLGQVDRAFGSGPVDGFDLRDESRSIADRKLSSLAEGPPFFYFERVVCAPQRVPNESRYLLDIEPEAADSKHFCPVARKRHYIHNLPTVGRFRIDPVKPRTIQGAFPRTRKCWPPWDTRTQLSCIGTTTAPATVLRKVRLALEKGHDHLNEIDRDKILAECTEWNLIWIGLRSVAALEPGEVETLLGLPRDHTRGPKRKDRYHVLGNSVQVDSIAYHFSVLKARFPSGIRVLSLFSGIGGAEVALDRLGIHLKVVVSAEFSETNRNIMRTWWEQSKQTGQLVQICDAQMLIGDYLETLVRRFGGFDLIVGGSLEQPSQFCHCSHTLEQVRQIMRRNEECSASLAT